MAFTKNDKEILRQLATKYMEYATLPVQKEKIRLWKALNRSEMERPMVVIDQLPWNEINLNGELDCHVSDPMWQGIERELRQSIYKWEHFPVDMVLDPFILIPKAVTNTGIGLSPEVERLGVEGNTDVYSQHYIPQITEPEDVEKIKDPIVTHDEKQSALWMQEARDIFEGVAPVRQGGGTGNMGVHLGVWDTLSHLMGVENIYYDFIDEPEFIHALMERITQSVISGIEQCNALHLHGDLVNTCHCSYIYTDDLLPDSGAGKGPQSQNCWAFGLAQLFTSVSPETMAEFEFPYINRMAEYFGHIYYGCCDRLDDRLEYVKKIPHVRKVSCSPWSDREHFAEQIGPELIMSNKPTPALVAGKFDPEAVRADLQRTYDAAKRNGVNLEFILKDISTVNHDPTRLEKWAKVAMEVVGA